MEGVWDGGTVGVHFPLTIYTEFGTSERGVNSNETSPVQGAYTTSRDCVIRYYLIHIFYLGVEACSVQCKPH